MFHFRICMQPSSHSLQHSGSSAGEDGGVGAGGTVLGGVRERAVSALDSGRQERGWRRGRTPAGSGPSPPMRHRGVWPSRGPKCAVVSVRASGHLGEGSSRASDTPAPETAHSPPLGGRTAVTARERVKSPWGTRKVTERRGHRTSASQSLGGS